MHYNEISPEFTQKFFDLVKSSSRVVITGHRSPDDDAVSSALATYEIVKLKHPDKAVRIIFSAAVDDRYKTFKNYDRIEFVEDLASEVSPDDLLIVLDGSQYHRFSTQPEKLASVKTKICIDHHASPIDDFTLSLVAPHIPAAAEVVYRSLAKDVNVSKELASIFLLGIIGDTGRFAYLKPNQTNTFLIAKELVEIMGIEIQEFLAGFDSISPREFEVLQEFTKNTRYGSLPGWPDFQYSYISEDFVKKGGYTEKEASGGAGLYKNGYLRTIKGYSWGFIMRPDAGSIYISMRSLPGSVNVRDMLERMQLGGGHDRAAGGTLKVDGKQLDSSDGIQFVLDWMKKNKPTLG